jgi:hypothetical protein
MGFIKGYTTVFKNVINDLKCSTEEIGAFFGVLSICIIIFGSITGVVLLIFRMLNILK